MPYDASTDQYYWLGEGYTALPNRDGSSPDGNPANSYHPEYPSPSFFTAWFELNQHVKSNKTLMDIVVVGELYRSKDKITGVSGKINIGSLLNWSVTEQATRGAANALTEEEIAKELLGLNETPIKLVGIYFRILD